MKKLGPAREVRHHCRGVVVHEERGRPTIGSSFSMHLQAAGHHLNELQGREQAVAAFSDYRHLPRPLTL